jgi:hypothetical protein
MQSQRGTKEPNLATNSTLTLMMEMTNLSEVVHPLEAEVDSPKER